MASGDGGADETAKPDRKDVWPLARVRRFIGIAEWLAAVGLVLPGLTGILPWLTPLAALGLMIVMGSAIVFHLSGRETQGAVAPGIIFVLATFVAYMRWLVLPS